jgi:hypothetical protein
LEPSGPPDPLVGVDVAGEDLEYCGLAFHLACIKESPDARRVSQIVQFTWKTAIQSGTRGRDSKPEE